MRNHVILLDQSPHYDPAFLEVEAYIIGLCEITSYYCIWMSWPFGNLQYANLYR
jgi:hypothetical protein